ncbi:MAG: NAD-dependent epimerase/dehydratase family protein [Rhodospirillaceae bacterium]|nr:NAD-dependent epimerase/dehydratase family protein [Rhodospirillaceae bacterium]
MIAESVPTTLVTGATGFVGSAVARALKAAGHRVRVLARPRSDRSNLEGLGVEVAEGDLLDPASFAPALRGCTLLFHVAADYRLWVPDPRPMYQANVEGTRRLLEAAGAAGLQRIVYTSSVATLGHTADGSPADEDTPVSLSDMIGHYKRSKFLAEQAVRELAGRGLPVVIVNPSTPVGPGDLRPTPTGRMVLEAAQGRTPAYVDTGLNIVHVDDVAQGHLLALERGRMGERYVLGGQNMALKDIFAAIAALTGRPAPRLRVPLGVVLPVAYAAEAWARVSGREPFVTVDGVRLAARKMYFSSARAERELGYRARPAVEALRDAVAWFRARGFLK